MKKILVIDDDPDLRTLMELTMRKQGYEVESASGKAEAFRKLSSFQPHVILLDVLLSGDDGRELCKEIKSMEAYRNLPVIMISAHPGATANISGYGADDFITKPIRTELLMKKIQSLVLEKDKNL